ncbi:uncharacterized protein LOC117007066 [Catharus ustulatus]|uniref:uncharacterized protein LOC117007066 n=1 Tax=Catharus ustulatus TaxID=91951 RepID=UPI001408B69E|nr:uncharacterized protein LOC117007066 [Catharus ustulatus]
MNSALGSGLFSPKTKPISFFSRPPQEQNHSKPQPPSSYGTAKRIPSAYPHVLGTDGFGMLRAGIPGDAAQPHPRDSSEFFGEGRSCQATSGGAGEGSAGGEEKEQKPERCSIGPRVRGCSALGTPARSLQGDRTLYRGTRTLYRGPGPSTRGPGPSTGDQDSLQGDRTLCRGTRTLYRGTRTLYKGTRTLCRGPGPSTRDQDPL